VSLKQILGKVFLCLVLQMGVLGGASMRPEDIEQLMKMSEPCVVQVMSKEKVDDPEDVAVA
jgi:hypothetical protein